MIYEITYVGERKFAHPVKSREELMALRNSPENLRNLAKARQGDQEAKMRLLQLAYNLGHVNGAIAGCKSVGSYFFHDVDCYDAEHSMQIKELILSKKDEIGLKCLERSASGGWHLVCQRVPGTTILENQVRVASILELEMDTGAKDLQRVVFSTSGSEEDLVYLDDCLFSEPMSPEQCEEEFKRLKVRVWQRKEQVPPGAKKANKHYRPWEEMQGNVMGDSFRVDKSNHSVSVGTGVAGTHGYDTETLSASNDGTADQKALPLKVGGVPPQGGREYDDADVNILPRRCATPPLPKGGSPMGSSPQETSLTAGEDTQKTLPLKIGGVPPQGGREYDDADVNILPRRCATP